MKSVKGKLLKTIIPITIAVMVVIILMISVITKNMLTDSANDLLISQCETNVNKVDGWVQSITSSLESVRNTLDNVKFENDDDRMRYLETTLKLNENFPQGVYIADSDNNLIMSNGYVADSSFVVTDRGWYKKGLTNNTMTFGEPYVDVQSGQYVASVSGRLKNLSNPDSVLSADIFLSSIADYISNVKIMENGISMLVDKDTNTILAHTDPEKSAYVIKENDEDKLMASIAGIIKDGISDVVKADSNDGKYMIKTEPVENTNWVLVSCVKESEVLARLRKSQSQLSIICLVAVVVLAVVVERTLNYVLKPVKGLTGAILKITDGDFTVDIGSKSNDEIGVMAGSLEKFIKNMRGIIASINETSHHLGDQSQNSGSVSKELHTLADGQSKSMDELSTTVEELSKSISEIAENATSLANVVSMANEDGRSADDRMVSTVEVAGKGKVDMEKVQTAMNEIKDSVESLKVTVQEVGESTTKIDGIINLIGDIASQTNLLALNAAIEAARAGEHGRGFAVVAEEIRHLAETSSDAVQQINTLIKDISSKVMDTVKKTETSAENINDNAALINTACETFDDIYDNINEASTIMKNMINKVNDVDQVATNMAAITEEQSASAEEILATSETLVAHAKKVTDSSENVAQSSQELADTSKSLKNYMKQFKI